MRKYSDVNIASLSLMERRGVEKYIVYLVDYGAPIGKGMALTNPERVVGLIVQAGNAYDEGLRDLWIR